MSIRKISIGTMFHLGKVPHVNTVAKSSTYTHRAFNIFGSFLSHHCLFTAFDATTNPATYNPASISPSRPLPYKGKTAIEIQR